MVVRHPAAYIRVDLDIDCIITAVQQQVIASLTCRHGWPDLEIYLDEDRAGWAGGDAIGALIAAVVAGRHDAVIFVGPGILYRCPAHLLRQLLSSCSRHGVSVDYLMPAQDALSQGRWPAPPPDARAGGTFPAPWPD